MDMFVANSVLHQLLIISKKNYPGNTDFPSAEMIAQKIFCATILDLN